MTIIAGLLIGALVVQQVIHKRQIDSLNAQASRERRALADRIQHPEILQVESMPPENHETPTDAAFFAAIGHIDPDLPPED